MGDTQWTSASGVFSQSETSKRTKQILLPAFCVESDVTDTLFLFRFQCRDRGVRDNAPLRGAWIHPSGSGAGVRRDAGPCRRYSGPRGRDAGRSGALWRSAAGQQRTDACGAGHRQTKQVCFALELQI